MFAQQMGRVALYGSYPEGASILSLLGWLAAGVAGGLALMVLSYLLAILQGGRDRSGEGCCQNCAIGVLLAAGTFTAPFALLFIFRAFSLTPCNDDE